jgi:hypothetical protein
MLYTVAYILSGHMLYFGAPQVTASSIAPPYSSFPFYLGQSRNHFNFVPNIIVIISL